MTNLNNLDEEDDGKFDEENSERFVCLSGGAEEPSSWSPTLQAGERRWRKHPEWICLPAGFSRSPGSGCGHSFTSCLFRAQFFSGAVQLFGRNWKQSNVCIKCRSGSRPVATVEFSPAERWNNGGSPSAAPHCHNHPEAPGWLLFVPSEPPSFFMAEIQNGSRVDVPQVLHNTITQSYSPNIVDTKLPSHHTPRSCGASTLPS